MRTTAGPSRHVQWVLSGRPVHRLIAGAAGPSRVAAAVTETCLATDMDLTGAECVSVWAARRRVGDPLAVRRLHQFAQHEPKPTSSFQCQP